MQSRNFILDSVFLEPKPGIEIMNNQYVRKRSVYHRDSSKVVKSFSFVNRNAIDSNLLHKHFCGTLTFYRELNNNYYTRSNSFCQLFFDIKCTVTLFDIYVNLRFRKSMIS